MIPTLREADNLPALLARLRQALDRTKLAWEILVVDDDSRDGTEEVIAAHNRLDPRIRLFVRTGQRGLSGAVLHGWRQTGAPILGVMDADLQHPPEILPHLVHAILRGCDLAIGSRYTRGGQLKRWSPARRLVSWCAVRVTQPILRPGLHASDPMSGFFLVRRRCLEHIRFQPSGFKLLLEILVRSRVRSVREIPIPFGRRRSGRSKANLRVAVDYVRLLARLYRRRSRAAAESETLRAEAS